MVSVNNRKVILSRFTKLYQEFADYSIVQQKSLPSEVGRTGLRASKAHTAADDSRSSGSIRPVTVVRTAGLVRYLTVKQNQMS
jgi:hypothetical protein